MKKVSLDLLTLLVRKSIVKIVGQEGWETEMMCPKCQEDTSSEAHVTACDIIARIKKNATTTKKG